MIYGADVAAFLGRPEDANLAAVANAHLPHLLNLARAYTRGAGFDSFGEPNAEIESVVMLAAARLVPNPAQLTSEDADGYSARGGFQGWTLTERLVLDNYRRKAA